MSALGVLLLSLSAAPARAASPAPTGTVQIGPIRAHDGFELYLVAHDCGATGADLEVSFRDTLHGDSLSHTYSGFNARCTIGRTAFGTTVTAHLPGVLELNAELGHLHAPLRHPGLPFGCSGPYGPEQPATATGRIDVSIHVPHFGRIATARAPAALFRGTPQTCPAEQTAAGRQLTATIGAAVLDAVAPNRGSAELEILDPLGDGPAAGIADELEVDIAGLAGYRVTADNGGLLADDAPFTSGGLSFTALSACPGVSSQNGTLSGTLTIDDPLFGALQLPSTEATSAYTGEGTQAAGACNGLGSQPVQPNLVTSCDVPNGGCSLASGAGTAIFFDRTDPGTQTILSEQVNFGDGSPPVSIVNDGSVQHTYTTASTFMATLTVTASDGSTTTATTPVYIDP